MIHINEDWAVGEPHGYHGRKLCHKHGEDVYVPTDGSFTCSKLSCGERMPDEILDQYKFILWSVFDVSI